jgi:uridine kinase
MSSKPNKVVVIGVAGDSGCGKSTFLRRLNDLFGKEFMTVICLDDYHSLDRKQRKVTGFTALNPRANNFDLMYEQVKALKEGKSVWKPIYNHETGLIDPPELIHSAFILILVMKSKLRGKFSVIWLSGVITLMMSNKRSLREDQILKPILIPKKPMLIW